MYTITSVQLHQPFGEPNLIIQSFDLIMVRHIASYNVQKISNTVTEVIS